jgi:hypothetical protein
VADAARQAAALGAGAELPALRLVLADLARLRGEPREAVAQLEERPADAGFGTAPARASILTARARLAESTDAARATLLHREAVTLARDLPLVADLANAVEGLAGVAGSGAAELLGVAVALRGTAVTGDPDVAAVAARARDLTGADAFAAAYARGAAMSRDEALTAIDAALDAVG